MKVIISRLPGLVSQTRSWNPPRLGWLFLGLVLSVGAQAADLTLEFELRWRGSVLAVPSIAQTGAEGRKLRVTRFAALISSVALARADGGVLRLDGQHGFIDAERERLTFKLRNVPEGDYKGLEFQVGLPPEVNHADPAQWPAGHPLNPIVNGLHWGWSGGYVFAAIEGRWRATAADEERGFSYHLATDARLMTVGFNAWVKVAGPTKIRLALDLGKVLGGHPLRPDDGSESTHSGPADDLAVVLSRAMERAWFLLESGPMPPAIEQQLGGDPPRAGSGTPRAFVVPTGFPQPELPADNPLTLEGVALGEFLFNDRRLSAGHAQSCASCHERRRAFAEARRTSVGVDGHSGTRNAMPLFNLAWSPSYAWDGSKPRLRDQARSAMINPIEMHADLNLVTAELSRDVELSAKFAKAFGTPVISSSRIDLALEQYLLTLVAADSKFDRVARAQATLTEQEQRGFALFAGEYDPVRGRRGADCFHCHGGALFTDFGFRDNGLGVMRGDAARARVTGRATDLGKFKTPSLRNVAVTAPYMHDGRLRTLEDVVAHYDHGVQRSPTLDPNLAKHPSVGLQLTREEQRSLVAFLHTLTDTELEPVALGKK